jgi:hypothetical protein
MPTDNAARPTASVPRKGMRRGTRSCYECRIRKIRCIFAKDSTVCDSCSSRGKRCTEQRRELLQEAALDNRESLRAQIARLEAVIQASKIDRNGADAVQTSEYPGLSSRDIEINGISVESASSSTVSHPTPAAIPSSNASISIGKDSPQNIDPIVTLFDNAIVRLRFYLNLWLLKSDIVETTEL